MDDEESVPPGQPPGSISKVTRDLSTNRLPARAEGTNELAPKDYLILIVDDSEDSLILFSLDLQQQGYRVVTASNGEQAVRVAAQTCPDAILMDIEMPELDGLGAAGKIRGLEMLKSVPIIAITALSTAGFQKAASDIGFNAYLTKPFDLGKMHELLRSLLPVK
jgi:CheY-like chemotaxis protein